MNAKQDFARMIAEDRRFGEKQKPQKAKAKSNGGVQQKHNNFRNMRPKDFLDMDNDE